MKFDDFLAGFTKNLACIKESKQLNATLRETEWFDDDNEPFIALVVEFNNRRFELVLKNKELEVNKDE